MAEFCPVKSKPKPTSTCVELVYVPSSRTLLPASAALHTLSKYSVASARQCVRVVKEMDSKSIGLCPQGFESPRCRLHLYYLLVLIRELNPGLLWCTDAPPPVLFGVGRLDKLLLSTIFLGCWDFYGFGVFSRGVVFSCGFLWCFFSLQILANFLMGLWIFLDVVFSRAVECFPVGLYGSCLPRT